MPLLRNIKDIPLAEKCRQDYEEAVKIQAEQLADQIDKDLLEYIRRIYGK